MLFHLLAKPTGAVCNLNCKYCFFLSKERLYPGSKFRMTVDTLNSYLRQYIGGQQGPEVEVAWQGGEPTLMGVDFFRKSVELAERYKKPGQRIRYTMQTNGVLLDDKWCEFFKTHDFLIGLSMDGPENIHNAYRVDKSGKGSFRKVFNGAELLKKHDVAVNILTCVHAANYAHPMEVYRFLRDEVQAEFIQFIPIVVRKNNTGFQEGDTVTEHSIGGMAYGSFLNSVFDEWVRHDVGRVFVQIFDVSLGSWLGAPPSLCIFADACGHALALEHNGDLYSCDHFVEPKYRLGNIGENGMAGLVTSAKQKVFGHDKKKKLPEYCRQCEVGQRCRGGCPKNRFIKTPDGEAGLNYLCEGYRSFFTHRARPMKTMAQLLKTGQPPARIMEIIAREDAGKGGN